MDYAIALFNATASGLIVVALLWAILSHRVLDGIIVKGGLIVMCLGFSTIALRFFDYWATDALRMDRAMLLINFGVIVVLFGYFWRIRNADHKLRRRLTDWTNFDSLPRTPE